MNSRDARSVARLTLALSTPGIFFRLRSMVAEQLAHVMPLTGTSILALATP